MEIIYQPHIDKEIELLIERIHPPRVCIDNDSCKDCTVVKIDSVNRHWILLEMVQVLTDLDLVISKSYVSSDGGWLLDVFHVTDQAGNKLTDKSLMHYIQQALCETRSCKEISSDIELHASCKGKQQNVSMSNENIVLEIAGTDKPGLLSEISVVLVDLGFNVTSATAWTHNDRVACIIYLEDTTKSRPINDPLYLAHIQDQVQNVVEAHYGKEEGERAKVRLASLVARCNHTERQLHRLMYTDGDHKNCHACHGDISAEHKKGCERTYVSVGRFKEKAYWVVNVRSKDRPKLLFDTVCVLTDMQYVVFHAAISSKDSMADQITVWRESILMKRTCILYNEFPLQLSVVGENPYYFHLSSQSLDLGSSELQRIQEYFVRHKDSSNLDNKSERQKLTQCLIAAIERRITHGLKLHIRTQNRTGLLSNVTRVIRENGLSVTRVEIGVEGETALGSFYVTDSSGQDVNPNIAEVLRRQTGGSIIVVQNSPYKVSQISSSRASIQETKSSIVDRPRFSLGSMLWSHLERLSNNLGLIRS